MRRTKPKRRSPVRIELTALVDVVLLLLIFFMVSARLVPEFGFELQLPTAKSAASLTEGPQVLRVSVDAEGQYFVEGEVVPVSELEARLSEAAYSRLVLLEADEAASHGAVIRVLDAAKLAGVESVQLAAELTQELEIAHQEDQ